MKRRISVGVDVGTYQVKVVVAETYGDAKEAPRIIGIGYAESRGLRHGYIINSSDAVKSISIAVEQAEKSSGIKIKKAFLSVGGIGLSSYISSGSVIISRADEEITELEIQKATENCESEIPKSVILNKKIIHPIPLQYKIDGKVSPTRPVGMKGLKLEVRVLFIMALEQHVNDLISCVEEVGIDIIDVMASPLAASLVTLSKTQKIAGCVLANIGAETLSVIVFDNNIPVSLEVFPIGSNDITNDIALGLKIPLEEAETIKTGGNTAPYSRRKLDEIISARLSDMFELVESHLKKLGRNGLLPAGIVITGGGSGIGNIDGIAKQSLRLPSRIGVIHFTENVKSTIKDSTWSVAYGLCIWGLSIREKTAGGLIIKTGTDGILGFIKKILP